MFRCLLIKFSFLLAMLCIAQPGLLGQGVTYTLLDKPESGSVFVEFSYQLEDESIFLSWEIDGNTYEDERPTHQFFVNYEEYADNDYDYDVILRYVNATSDSTDLRGTINVLAALFHIESDSELGDESATLKRVLRSNFDIEASSEEDLGDFSFKWDIIDSQDESIIPPDNPIGFAFDPTDNESSYYPNIYITFPNGGDYTVSLEVTDGINSPNFTGIFEQVITLDPEHGEQKLPLKYLPRALTPQNPDFIVQSCGTTSLEFKVFSRWGSLVYHENSNVINWGGRNYHGNPLPEGIYYYIISNPEGKYEEARGFFYVFK